MKYIVLFIIITLVILLCCNLESSIEPFRQNKCFSCERDIPYLINPNMAFPSKCFDCEKKQEPVTCFDCNKKNSNFEMYGRNIRYF